MSEVERNAAFSRILIDSFVAALWIFDKIYRGHFPKFVVL